MILVTGANGTIGSHLVGSVVSRGGSVRVLVRDTGKAQAIFGDRVDIVRGDLTDPSSVTVALKGVDSVFLNSPSLEGFVGMQRSVIDAAERIGRAVGMDHIVGGATWMSAAVTGPSPSLRTTTLLGPAATSSMTLGGVRARWTNPANLDAWVAAVQTVERPSGEVTWAFSVVTCLPSTARMRNTWRHLKLFRPNVLPACPR